MNFIKFNLKPEVSTKDYGFPSVTSRTTGKNIKPLLLSIIALTALLLGVIRAEGRVTRADYERALGLREQWQYLTKNVAEPAVWIGTSHRFYYRKTIAGGHQYIMVDADTLKKVPAFDHARLAAALSKELGEPVAANRLPFSALRFSDDGSYIQFNVGSVPWEGQWWTCRLSDYACSKLNPRLPCQPRGFGVVRDLEVPADRSPRQSPDGQWEVIIHNFNVAVRPTSGGPLVILSTDG